MACKIDDIMALFKKTIIYYLLYLLLLTPAFANEVDIFNLYFPYFTHALEVEINNKRIIRLTFDDGPSQHTYRIRKILNKYNAKSTFFVLGKKINKHNNLIKQLVNEGHVVANHSFTHDSLNIINNTKYLESEYNRTNKELTLFGASGNIVRPPYGSKNKYTLNYLISNNYTVVYWDIDSQDTKDGYTRNIHKIVNSVLIQLSKTKKNDIIILFHDGGGHYATAKALEILFPKFIEMGFEIKTI